MSGPEIVLNEIRSLLSFDAPPHPLADRLAENATLLWEKVTFAAAPAAFISVGYILANLLGLIEAPSAGRRVVIRIAGLVVVGLAILLSFWFEASHAVQALYQDIHERKVFDTVTPVLALGFEFYTDISKAILNGLEIAIAGGLGWLMAKARGSFLVLSRQAAGDESGPEHME
jgi:hypothetical protein